MLDQRAGQASPPVPEYARELVRGVQAHRAQIDELLGEQPGEGLAHGQREAPDDEVPAYADGRVYGGDG